MSIAKTAIVFPQVILGENAIVEDFCVIGCPPAGREGEVKPTIIGPGAVIRSHTVIYHGNVIGAGFQAGHKANVREDNVIGERVSLGTLSVVEHDVRIGDGVRIHTQVFVPEYSVLEDGCWLGPNVVITNAKYPQSRHVKAELKGAHIKRGAIIGANSTLLPGVVVGERCLIGAGSLVAGDTEPYGVYFGHPARRVRDIRELPYDFQE